jgi:hypothetical protein
MTKTTLNVVFVFEKIYFCNPDIFSIRCMFFQECVTLLHSISFFAFEGMYLFSYLFKIIIYVLHRTDVLRYTVIRVY